MMYNTQNYWGFWILSIVRYSRNWKTMFSKLDLFLSSGEWGSQLNSFSESDGVVQ
jgi:hypothetical protein